MGVHGQIKLGTLAAWCMAIAAAYGQSGMVRVDGTNVYVIFSNCPPCAVVQALPDSSHTNWVDVHMSKRLYGTNGQGFSFQVPVEFSGMQLWRVRSCVNGN